MSYPPHHSQRAPYSAAPPQTQAQVGYAQGGHGPYNQGQGYNQGYNNPGYSQGYPQVSQRPQGSQAQGNIQGNPQIMQGHGQGHAQGHPQGHYGNQPYIPPTRNHQKAYQNPQYQNGHQNGPPNSQYRQNPVPYMTGPPPSHQGPSHQAPPGPHRNQYANQVYDTQPRRPAPKAPKPQPKVQIPVASNYSHPHSQPMRSPQSPYPINTTGPNTGLSVNTGLASNYPAPHSPALHSPASASAPTFRQKSPQLPYPTDDHPQNTFSNTHNTGVYAPPQNSPMPVPPPPLKDSSGRASPITLAQRRMQPTPAPVYTDPNPNATANGNTNGIAVTSSGPGSAEVLTTTDYGYGYAIDEPPTAMALQKPSLQPQEQQTNSYYESTFSPQSTTTTAATSPMSTQPLNVSRPGTSKQQPTNHQSTSSGSSNSSLGPHLSNEKPPPRRNYTSSTSDPLTEASEKPKPLTVEEFERIKQQAANRPQDAKLQLELVKKYIEACDVLPMRYTDPDTPANGGAQIFETKYESRNREVWTKQALKIIKKLVQANYPDALFYLGSAYSSATMGLELDYDKAYELYFKAANREHAEAAYRVAVCNEIGVGTRRDPQKAISWYKKASLLGDVSAMYKLGMISLNGLLGQPKNFMEAVTWLQRAAEKADKNTPHAVHELGLLYEKGSPDAHADGAGYSNYSTATDGAPVISKDDKKAFDLFVKAARLGYPPSMFRLGSAYEYGTLACDVDPKRSIAWYSRAAEKGDPESELALSGWYLTGSEGILRQSDTEAYLWARKAAEKSMSKAEYALGYFSEVGIGVKADIEEAKKWYRKAAAQRHPKAVARLQELREMEF